MIPLVGFLPADDPRMIGTVAAIEERLMRDGFVQRYDSDADVDGLPTGEGAFLPCTFWLADNLALQGRRDEAREIYDRLLDIRNDVGLLAEEYDPSRKRQLGNFPQAFSHVCLVNTARNLSQDEGGPSSSGMRRMGRDFTSDKPSHEGRLRVRHARGRSDEVHRSIRPEAEPAPPGFGRVMAERLLVQLDAPAGLLGDRQVAIVDDRGSRTRSLRGGASSGVYSRIRKFGVDDGEVGVDDVGHRSHRVVGSHDDVMRLGHGGDLLHLQDAAAEANIGLDDIERLGLEDRLELELGVIAFAAGQGNRDMRGQLGQGIDVLGSDRLLEPERM